MQRFLPCVIISALFALSVGAVKAMIGGSHNDDLQGAVWMFAATNPTLTTTAAVGGIIACESTPSVSPYIEHFTVSGNSLTNTVTAAAPVNFEVSLDANTGYAASVIIPPASGAPDKVSATIYVRAAANATAGPISGNVVISSLGAPTQTVAVSGTVKAKSKVDQVPDQTYYNDQIVAPIDFTGSATSYHWVSDNPSITIDASGENRIPQYKAINQGNTPIIVHITVTPANDNGCPGDAMKFIITVMPETINTGTITVPNKAPE